MCKSSNLWLLVLVLARDLPVGGVVQPPTLLFAARGRQMDDTFGKNWVSFMNEAEHKMVCW